MPPIRSFVNRFFKISQKKFFRVPFLFHFFGVLFRKSVPPEKARNYGTFSLFILLLEHMEHKYIYKIYVFL